MKRFHIAAWNSTTGLPIANPSVKVFHDDGVAVATIYSDEGVTTKPNPFIGDSQGRGDFYAPDGDYLPEISGTGVTTYTIQDVTIVDGKRGGFGVSDSLVSQFANAFYLRRTAQYNRIDTAKAAWNLELDATNDYLRVLRAASGANPITWTEWLRLTSGGLLLFKAPTGTTELRLDTGAIDVLTRLAFYENGLDRWIIDNVGNADDILRFTSNTVSNILVLTQTGGIGFGTASPAASALLDLTSTTKALLVSRMTTAQRDALTAANGMILYNTTTATMQGFIAGAWVNL